MTDWRLQPDVTPDFRCLQPRHYRNVHPQHDRALKVLQDECVRIADTTLYQKPEDASKLFYEKIDGWIVSALLSLPPSLFSSSLPFFSLAGFFFVCVLCCLMKAGTQMLRAYHASHAPPPPDTPRGR